MIKPCKFQPQRNAQGYGGSLTLKQVSRQMSLLTPWTLRAIRRMTPKSVLNVRKAARRPLQPMKYREIQSFR